MKSQFEAPELLWAVVLCGGSLMALTVGYLFDPWLGLGLWLLWTATLLVFRP